MSDDYDDGMDPVMTRQAVEYDGDRYVAEILGPADWSPDQSPGDLSEEDVRAWERGEWVSVSLRVTAEAPPFGSDSIGAMLGNVPSLAGEQTVTSIIDEKLAGLVHSAGIAPGKDALTVQVTREVHSWTGATMTLSRSEIRSDGYDPDNLDPSSGRGVAAWIRATGADAHVDYDTGESEDDISAIRPVS
jgi:hypothetical protein